MNKSTWIAVSAAAALVVLLLLAPVKPPKPANFSLSLEQEIDSAIAMVTGGQMPMLGIQKLKALETAHPENERVIYNLALFSIQSGQIEKGRQRFGTLTELVPDNAEYWFHLAMCDYRLNDTIQAIREFEMVVETAQETELSEAAREYLYELKN